MGSTSLELIALEGLETGATCNARDYETLQHRLPTRFLLPAWQHQQAEFDVENDQADSGECEEIIDWLGAVRAPVVTEA